MTTNALLTTSVVGFLFGCFLGITSTSGTYIGILALVLGVHFLIWYGVTAYNKRRVENILQVTIFVFVTLGVLFLSLFGGVVRGQMFEEKNVFECDTCTFFGEVVRHPKLYDDKQEVVVMVKEQDTEYQYVRVIAPLYPQLSREELLQIRGTVKPPKAKIETKGNFRYDIYLQTRGIGSESYYPSITKLSNINQKKSISSNAHELTSDKMDTLIAQPVSLLARSMVIGDDVLTSATKENFRVTGISHITVLSGYNIALVVAVLGVLLKFIPFTFRIICMVAGVVFFVSSTDGGYSLVRASIMAIISLAALFFGRGYVASRALFLSLYIIALIDPYSALYDISLHLSFLATIGIIYLAPRMSSVFEKKLPRYISDVCAVTTACTCMTLPYVMMMFGTVSLYTVIINILVAYFVPLFTLSVMAVVVLSLVSHPLAEVVGFFVFLVGQIILHIADIGARIPYALVEIHITTMQMILMYVFIFSSYLYTTLHDVTQKNETLHTEGNEIWSPVMKF
jgi:ComEC/Rec2-related protein